MAVAYLATPLPPVKFAGLLAAPGCGAGRGAPSPRDPVSRNSRRRASSVTTRVPSMSLVDAVPLAIARVEGPYTHRLPAARCRRRGCTAGCLLVEPTRRIPRPRLGASIASPSRSPDVQRAARGRRRWPCRSTPSRSAESRVARHRHGPGTRRPRSRTTRGRRSRPFPTRRPRRELVPLDAPALPAAPPRPRRRHRERASPTTGQQIGHGAPPPACGECIEERLDVPGPKPTNGPPRRADDSNRYDGR